jgi:hypothetical protein
MGGIIRSAGSPFRSGWTSESVELDQQSVELDRRLGLWVLTRNAESAWRVGVTSWDADILTYMVVVANNAGGAWPITSAEQCNVSFVFSLSDKIEKHYTHFMYHIIPVKKNITYLIFFWNKPSHKIAVISHFREEVVVVNAAIIIFLVI